MSGHDKARKVRESIDQNLKRVYDNVLDEDLPSSLVDLLKEIDEQSKEQPGPKRDRPTR